MLNLIFSAYYVLTAYFLRNETRNEKRKKAAGEDN